MLISEDFFRLLERQRTAALVQRDMNTAWTLHAPEYQLITPGGKTFTRERHLDAIATWSQATAIQEPAADATTAKP